jgi:hypothetical protein
MFKNYFKGIEGIETYPLILLVVFVLFFSIMLISLFRTSNDKINEIKKIPFDK